MITIYLYLVVRATATYSASILKCATELCLLLRQAIGPPANVNTIPDIDQEESMLVFRLSFVDNLHGTIVGVWMVLQSLISYFKDVFN